MDAEKTKRIATWWFQYNMVKLYLRLIDFSGKDFGPFFSYLAILY